MSIFKETYDSFNLPVEKHTRNDLNFKKIREQNAPDQLRHKFEETDLNLYFFLTFFSYIFLAFALRFK